MIRVFWTLNEGQYEWLAQLMNNLVLDLEAIIVPEEFVNGIKRKEKDSRYMKLIYLTISPGYIELVSSL